MGQETFHRIKSKLEEEGINYKILKHKSVQTSKEAAEVRQVALKTGVKAMVFKERKEEKFLMALVPADEKVNVEKLESVSDLSLDLASPDQVKSRTGCEVGSVPPFGFEEKLETYMDRRIPENDEVNFNAGLHTRSVQMKSEDLKSILDPEMCRIGE